MNTPHKPEALDTELEAITKILLKYHSTEPHAYLEAAEVGTTEMLAN